MLGFFKKNKIIEIISPATGRIIPIEEVEDETFAKKRTGDGIAVELTDGKIIAPFDGEIISMYNANHCLVIRSEDGIELLIHIGIDTIKLKGEGFKKYVELNDKVNKGDTILEADIDLLKSKNKSVVTPIIITNRRRIDSIEKMKGNVEKGKDKIMNIKVKKE
ncbi:PTS sugar transporter subunit IIA [Anaerosalibacter massiliensis]|uniref:PTS glucose transporter subunit IIA n=1 Tax=Anaerosalibacter massiliensis TaxID=1347392 RepID=A0A9X2MK40_9FIRM|nr:PTS glucose transporter subunit IIA [Anaerosalibacter massiliensis]MCR2045204.1 PTS glucose transporter subunit IIA [Anaerosalibacter massiliensis]